MQAGKYPIPYIITRFSSFCKGLRKYLAVSTHICQIEGDDAATQASSTKSAAMAHSFKVTSSTVSTGSGRMGSGPRSANTMSGKLLWVQLLEMGTSAPVAR